MLDGLSFRKVLRIWLVSLSSLKKWLVMSIFFFVYQKKLKNDVMTFQCFVKKLLSSFYSDEAYCYLSPIHLWCYFQQKWNPYLHSIFFNFVLIFILFCSLITWFSFCSILLLLSQVNWHISRYSHYLSYHLCLCVLLERPVFFFQLVLYNRSYQL